MRKSIRIILEVPFENYSNTLRLLRLIGISDVFNETRQSTNVLDFYIRESDIYYFYDNFKRLIDDYQNKYDTLFEYHLAIDNDVSLSKDECRNIVKFNTSYKDCAIFFEPAFVSNYDIYDTEKEISSYMDEVFSKKYKYILPAKGNEFIISSFNYLDNFKLNLMNIDSMHLNELSNVLIIGENNSVYGSIIHDIIGSDVILSNSLDNIIEQNFDLVVYLLDRFDDKNAIDLFQYYNLGKTKNLIIGNISSKFSNIYEKYAESLKIHYRITVANNWSSIVVSDENYDEHPYLYEYGNGY